MVTILIEPSDCAVVRQPWVPHVDRLQLLKLYWLSYLNYFLRCLQVVGHYLLLA